MLPERSDALVGAMLGKDYRVLQPIGTGGMAVVYLVEHQTLLKRFAAKVLSSDLASSDEARARFTQEAHAASQLDHENIVTITDFGITADHRPFFVMELLRGQTLDERLTDGPMTIEEVVAVAVPVARALAHAHAEGIVHRDVKPENIFLVQRSQGRWGVKVVDFGIAKTPINPKLTNMGETLGSPLFMAPEMIRGEDDVDQRADVYSFGVLLYLMLCGRLPFFDENLLKVMQMHLSAAVPPGRSVNPSLSPALSTILDRALAKNPDNRYPSMDALLIDLEAALPPGSDRMLIEAQSGAVRGETPFAAALAIPRTESQRGIRSEPALRTMRVQPLPSPLEEPKLPPLRRSGPSRAAIVLGSALLTGALGVGAWKYLQHRHAMQRSASAALPQMAPADPVAAAAPAPAASAGSAAPSNAAPTIAAEAGAAAPNGAPGADAAHAAAGGDAVPIAADAAHAAAGANSAPIADAAHARTSANSAPIADAAHARTRANSPPVADAARAPSSAAAPSVASDAAHARPGTAGSVASVDAAHGRAGASLDAARPRPGSASAETGKPRAAATAVATGKRPAVRPKTPPRRDAQGRAGKRVAAIAPANSTARPGSAAAPAAEIEAASGAPPATEPAEREVGSAAEPAPQPAAPTAPSQLPAQPGPGGPPKAAPTAPPAPPAPPASAPLPTTPPPVPPRPVAPAGPGSLDAVPAVATLDVKGSLSPAVVRRSMERTLGSLRACYQSAARAGNATPAVDLQLRFEIDENSMATHVSTSGQSFGSLASCAANVVGQLHTQEAPDVGTAQVSVLIRFRPS